jgi:hypothetical protein
VHFPGVELRENFPTEEKRESENFPVFHVEERTKHFRIVARGLSLINEMFFYLIRAPSRKTFMLR